jgi:S1-C subfamily serine protease
MRIFCALLVIAISIEVLADHGAQTWENAHRSVVSVLPTWPGFQRPGHGAPRGTAPEGSGIAVNLSSFEESPLILTAAHVVDRATRVQIRESEAAPLLDAEVLWKDHDADIALLKTENARRVFHLTARSPKPGEHVCAIGNPFGLGVSMSCGVVSGPNRLDLGFNPIEDFIQTDAAVNPGASGGALVNADGKLLGMIAAIYTKEADIDAGVNFAISSKLLIERMKQFKIP